MGGKEEMKRTEKVGHILRREGRNEKYGNGLDTSLGGKEEMKIIDLDWTRPEEGRRK